jgi:hypothetical protein
MSLDLAELKRSLVYDPDTGVFTRRVNSAWVKAGAAAGSINKAGYRVIYVQGERHYAHRLAWAYCHGHLPALQIDHINQAKDDNRISNLREVTAKQNRENIPAHSDSGTGIRGVCWRKDTKKWLAQIGHNGEHYYLGQFNTVAQASAAYKAAAEELFTHHTS